jgi:conjugal transfer/type IV secretion protein DotA/TraY
VQRSLNYMIVLLTAAALFALAPVGDADAAPPTATSLFGSPNDAPIQWLQNTVQGSNAVIPENFLGTYGIYNNNASGSIQAGLQMVLSWYSYAMLVIGSFLLLYYLVRIIAETAHTGRPGGRANQLWAPIRTVLAIGLLVPLSTGLNSGQMIVLNLASEGSALASNTWTQFLSAMAGSIATGANGALSSSASAAAEEQAVYNFFLNQVCVKLYNTMLTQSSFATAAASLSGGVGWPITATTHSLTPSGTLYTYGNNLNQTMCGQVQVDNPTAVAAPSGATAGTNGSTLNTQMSTASQTLANDIMSKINNAWNSDVQSMMLAAGGPVDQYVNAVLAGNNPPAGILTTLQGYAVNYNQDLTSGVTTAMADSRSAIDDALTDDAVALGWLSAGTMYMTIARLQSTVSDALMYAPTVTAPNLQALRGLTTGGRIAVHDAGISHMIDPDPSVLSLTSMGTLENRLVGYLGAASNLIANQGTAPTAFTMQSGQIAAASGPETNSGGLLGLIDNVYSAIQGSGVISSGVFTGNLPWLGNVVPTGGFPISDLAVLGANLMKMGAALYALGIASGMSFFGFSGGSGISMLGFAFGTALFAPGIALGYILPLLPFIHFLFAVFGWLLALVEAVIEIPIFALAHLDPEGEGVFPGATKAGYMLLLQLILRPLLICIGLIISILLMNGMVDFLNLVFNATVFGVQTVSAVGTFSLIIYTVIYAGTAYAICNACFKAIDYVPNHALRWIGGQGDMHDSGQHAGYATAAAMGTASAANTMAQIGPQLAAGIGRGIEGTVAGAAGGLTGAATSAAGGGANSAASAAPSASQMGTDSAGNKFNLGEGVSRMAGGMGDAAQLAAAQGVGDGLQAAGGSQPAQEQTNKPPQRDPTSFIT